MKDLQRFGHHPDPGTDFCIEVDQIAGMIEDEKAGLLDEEVVRDHIFKAMMFRVGGTERAVVAKQRLRKLEDEFMARKGNPKVDIPDILKTLAEWAKDPHDWICPKEGSYGSPCRHTRAALAIVEVNNAIAELRKKAGLKA